MNLLSAVSPLSRLPRPAAVLLALLSLAACQESTPPAPAAAAKVQPALSVSVIQPRQREWPQRLNAGGSVAAWQEVAIGAELGGYRITEVRAQVGDRVKKGQVLARISADAVNHELAESQAAVSEAKATLVDAHANLERSVQLRAQGFYSAQQNSREQAASETAEARLAAAEARLKNARLRQSKTTVTASDDGLISGRTATVGALCDMGKELFRLIRHGRLEWRAEVTAAELHRIEPGRSVLLSTPDGATLTGKVRVRAPTVDPQTRLGLVYVDLPADAHRQVSAGMFLRGEFQLGQAPALTLPQTAVLLRDGFAYVFRVESEQEGQARIAQFKVQTGRQQDGEIEVSGLAADARIVAAGVGFLSDGDSVKLVAAARP